MVLENLDFCAVQCANPLAIFTGSIQSHNYSNDFNFNVSLQIATVIGFTYIHALVWS